MTGFDEAYACYLGCLAKLDKTDDISEKNMLFRELTEQLSVMEQKLQSQQDSLRYEAPEDELTYFI